MTYTDKEIDQMKERQLKESLQKDINLFKLLVWFICLVVFLLLLWSSIHSYLRIMF